MSCFSVLRIGPIDSNNGHAALLRSAIITHFNEGKARHDAPSQSSSSSRDKSQHLTISNRYFDANICLTGLHETTDSIVDDQSACLLQEDGIILVFDSSATSSSTSLSSSFDSLGLLHNSAEEMDRAGDLLRLCVGVSMGPTALLSDGTKKSEQEYSRRVLWCLDRGYEYVEADLTREGLKAGHDERDKEGFARIVEAISSCMWSSHVMKSSRDMAAPSLMKESGSLNEKQNLQSDDKIVDHEGISSLPNTNDTNREAAAVACLMEGVEDTSNNTNTSTEEAQGQIQQEIALNEFEHVIAEAKRIREASQSDSMTDEERRQRAGDAAMRLMGILDTLGFDEDGDETDGSSVEDQ